MCCNVLVSQHAQAEDGLCEIGSDTIFAELECGNRIGSYTVRHGSANKGIGAVSLLLYDGEVHILTVERCGDTVHDDNLAVLTVGNKCVVVNVVARAEIHAQLVAAACLQIVNAVFTVSLYTECKADLITVVEVGTGQSILVFRISRICTIGKAHVDLVSRGNRGVRNEGCVFKIITVLDSLTGRELLDSSKIHVVFAAEPVARDGIIALQAILRGIADVAVAKQK